MPTFATWAEYAAATPDEQRAYWDWLLKRWRENLIVIELDDCQSDRDRARIDREWCA